MLPFHSQHKYQLTNPEFYISNRHILDSLGQFEDYLDLNSSATSSNLLIFEHVISYAVHEYEVY